MKFKATVKDPKTFSSICSTAKSFQRRCIVKLDAKRLRFITDTAIGGCNGGPQVWSSGRTEALLENTKIESRRDNEIYCEVPDIQQIVGVLKKTNSSAAVNTLMRLAKVDGCEVLRFTSIYTLNPATTGSVSCAAHPSGRGGHTSATALSHDVSHDVPIRVLTEGEINSLTAPPLENRLIHVYLPSLQDLALLVEKLRNAGCTSINFSVKLNDPNSSLQAHLGSPLPCQTKDSNVDPHKGTATTVSDTSSPAAVTALAATSMVRYASLTISGDTYTTNFNLSYSRVEVAVPGGQHPPPPPVISEAECSVSLKTVGRFLAVKEVNPSRIVMHVVDGKALVFSAFAVVGETNLVYYIPALLERN